jgi:hypothetical protein
LKNVNTLIDTCKFAITIVAGMVVIIPCALFLSLEHGVTHSIRKKKSWLDQIEEDCPNDL